MEARRKLTFGSLFAGIGGFDLGFERAGLECRWHVEIDPYCQKVLAKHWPDVKRYSDVTKFCRRIYDCEPENEEGEVWCPRCDAEFGECECIRTDQVLDECGPVDVICGGFPCQDISNAGKRAGIDGERSGLWSEYIRIVRELRPRFVVVENVAALLTRGMGRVLGDLAESGYDAEWDCLPAAAFGAPHLRKRIFIVAYTGCERIPIGGIAGNVACTPGAAEEETPERERLRNASGDGCANVSHTIFAGRERHVGEILAGASDGRQDADIARSDWWATEPDVGRVANGVSSRVHRLRGLGNAVVPQIAEWIGRRLMECTTDGNCLDGTTDNLR